MYCLTLSRLSLRLQAWRFSIHDASQPKLKQPDNSITNNRGGQPYNDAKMSTL